MDLKEQLKSLSAQDRKDKVVPFSVKARYLPLFASLIPEFLL